MTVKELITTLLDMDINKNVSIEYPARMDETTGNYSRYEEAQQFEIKEYYYGVVIGASNDD